MSDLDGPRGGRAFSSIKRWLPKVCAVAKIEYGRKLADGTTFHTFRHTMASLALNAGVPEIVVQQMGNWKTASIVGGGQSVVKVTAETPAALSVAAAASH